MDEQLKELMHELGQAISDSLSDSERIAGAIGEIRKAGYDVFLVLEATIGFNKREKSDEEGDDAEVETRLETEFTAETPSETSAKLKFTAQDQKFLRALKIAVDEEVR